MCSVDRHLLLPSVCALALLAGACSSEVSTSSSNAVEPSAASDTAAPETTEAATTVAETVDQLLDTIGAAYDADPTRTFATGHSNGGMLSYRLACELSDRIVAVALQAGSLGVEPCEPTTPVSLLHLHGTADTNHPIEGGFGSGLANVDFRSAIDSVTMVAAAGGCSGEPTVTVDATNPDLTATTWTDCDGGTEVQLVAVEGAPHAWMGHTPSNPSATPAYTGLDASIAVLQFLFAHPRAA